MSECCDDLAQALKLGLLERVRGEVMLPRRKLTEAAPEAKAGNVLTGETYDPSTFAVSMALTYCAWCGAPISEGARYAEMDKAVREG